MLWFEAVPDTLMAVSEAVLSSEVQMRKTRSASGCMLARGMSLCFSEPDFVENVSPISSSSHTNCFSLHAHPCRKWEDLVMFIPFVIVSP